MDLKEETSMDSEKTSMVSKKKHIVICPRVEAKVQFREGRFHLETMLHGDPKEKKCEAANSLLDLFQVEETKYVYCYKCYGNGHEECYKSSPIKHHLHPKHTLMFVRQDYLYGKCICCEDPLKNMFYWCPSCDFCINMGCVEKQPLITIDHPKRHEHTLTLFPRQVTTNCNVCALDHSRSPIYICPACDFVVHKSCIYLPWSIRISRHPQHRLSFTSSFDLAYLICNICRRKINSDYGGYICNKEGCSYFAHSRCATGKNVWDGKELEGVPEEVEEEVEPPFERLGDGTISHFSHKDHPLKLNIEDSTRVYDDSRSCQACLTPIYYGNFYSCTLDCCFTLHEACANLSRRTYHDIHPHPLLLRVETPDVFECSACNAICSGFFYECCRKECFFRLHVQCATAYEPLVHNSHVHSLFLTSAPEECRRCSICNGSGLKHFATNETFNCIESECEFSLCYKCAVIPQKVRYKHDDHILTLLYGEDTSEIQNWCELCEMKIKKCERFYACEDCCVTLHIECLLGRDMNYKLGSYWSYPKWYDVIPNGMTRPVCSTCHKRCNQKFIFQVSGFECCSHKCMISKIFELL